MALKGKTAIVTGGAQGIGYAIAKRMLHDGARVMIADINKTEGKKAQESLSAYGDASFITTDVGNRLDVHNLLAAVLEKYGDVDILVNNAGIVHAAEFLDIDEADFDAVMRVNLKGAFLCGQTVGRYMADKVESGGAAGTIINISSVNDTLAIPNQVPYCVSKAGLSQLTKVMALSMAQKGIRVNAVGPGSIMTAMLSSVNSDTSAREKILSRTPMGRIGDSNEVAAIVSFLASDDASYITGQTIHCDGGRLALNYVVRPPDS